jgi:hypothetical protein
VSTTWLSKYYAATLTISLSSRAAKLRTMKTLLSILIYLSAIAVLIILRIVIIRLLLGMKYWTAQ